MQSPAGERYPSPLAMTKANDVLAEFEALRGELRGIAFRMLGSLADADDALQEAWLRVAGADASAVTHVRGWIVTITSRVCLDVLRARRRQRSAMSALGETWPRASSDAEAERELAESVGLALLVVLERLAPAERAAFVLHEACSLSFEEIASVLERSPAAAKKLASRARVRLRGEPVVSASSLRAQRDVAERFLAASRAGDVQALLAVLHPDVVRREDLRTGVTADEIRGATRVAEETARNARLARFARAALVDGVAGVVVAPQGVLRFVIALRIDEGLITALTVSGRAERLAEFSLALIPQGS